MNLKLKTTARDMTEGSIVQNLILFAAPLLLGNTFQLLYSTVDSLVVGNFVGTEALAAVSSTFMISMTMIYFFNGLALGGSVIVGQAGGVTTNWIRLLCFRSKAWKRRRQHLSARIAVQGRSKEQIEELRSRF